MAEIWLGRQHSDTDGRQRALFDDLNLGGVCPLESARPILPGVGCGEPDVRDAERIPLLAELVRADQRAIVSCWPGDLGRILQPLGLNSPHGPLPGGRLPHHAIYVFGAQDEYFAVFDPWHDSRGQPLHLSWDDLARAWTGMMLVIG